MKNIFLIIFVFLCQFGFSQKKSEKAEIRCPKIYKHKIKNIVIEPFLSVVQNDTIQIFEAKYECVYSALYTHKAMFDKFGKWKKSVPNKNQNNPNLIWEKVSLFDDGKKYTVVTTGVEEWKYIYAGVSVFDENGKDLLAESSSEKQKIIDYFSELIIKNDDKKDAFYELYWTTFNPKRWKEIQSYK